MTTAIRICFEYDGKVVYSRQVSITKSLAKGLINTMSNQIDMMADTLLKADARVPFSLKRG